MQLFTPQAPEGNPWGAPEREPGRLTLHVSAGLDLTDEWQPVETDYGVMRARRAPCGLGCVCDAEVIPL